MTDSDWSDNQENFFPNTFSVAQYRHSDNVMKNVLKDTAQIVKSFHGKNPTSTFQKNFLSEVKNWINMVINMKLSMHQELIWADCETEMMLNMDEAQNYDSFEKMIASNDRLHKIFPTDMVEKSFLDIVKNL